MKPLLIAIIILVITMTGCNSPARQIDLSTAKGLFNETLPGQVSKLQELNLSNVETFEQYKHFADNLNSLIHVLNRQNDLFNIPEIPATQEAWEKASRAIEKYGPLINNYNEVVKTAKIYDKNSNDENLKIFYISSMKFGVEAAIIVGAVYYKAAYEATGIVYRAVGLNRIAPICPECIKAVLSNLHWTIRTTLTEESSKMAQWLANIIDR